MNYLQGSCSLLKFTSLKSVSSKVGDQDGQDVTVTQGIVAKIVRDEDMPIPRRRNSWWVPFESSWCTFTDEPWSDLHETIPGMGRRKTRNTTLTPIFDGATIEQIDDYVPKAGLPKLVKSHSHDGGT